MRLKCVLIIRSCLNILFSFPDEWRNVEFSPKLLAKQNYFLQFCFANDSLENKKVVISRLIRRSNFQFLNGSKYCSSWCPILRGPFRRNFAILLIGLRCSRCYKTFFRANLENLDFPLKAKQQEW